MKTHIEKDKIIFEPETELDSFRLGVMSNKFQVGYQVLLPESRIKQLSLTLDELITHMSL